MQEPSDLELLIRSRYPIIVVDSLEEHRVEQVVERCARRLELPLFTWTVVQGLQRQDADAPMYDTLEPAKALANLHAIQPEAIFYFKDLEQFLDDPTVQRTLYDLTTSFGRDRRTVVVSGAGLRLPAKLQRLAACLKLELPGRDRLLQIARTTLERLSAHHQIRVTTSPQTFGRLVDGLAGLTEFEAERAFTQVILRDMAVTESDIAAIAELKRDRLGNDGLLELDTGGPGACELAGLDNLRAWLQQRRRAFDPEAAAFGLQAPRGILLLGVQGCGKSMTARTVANAWDMPLLRLYAGRLYDKFIGESERRLESALQLAERMSPCVLLIDEIEKALATGDGNGDAGLSRRLLARILGWLQDRTAPVFVVATCNSVRDLPPEIMRKGRFDEVFFVDLPERTERQSIFALHLQRRERDPRAFDLPSLADASAGFSGAEIEQVVVAALYSAFADGELKMRHLIEEIRATRPLSVVRAEEIEALRRWARGRTVSASRAAAA